MMRRPSPIEYALEEWRLDRNWTREQLAEWLGITVDTLAKMGRDQTPEPIAAFTSSNPTGGAPRTEAAWAKTLSKRYEANPDRLVDILAAADTKRGVTR